jgi:hypothetical protein
LDWWSSWGICEKDEGDEGISPRYVARKFEIGYGKQCVGSYKNELELKLDGECNFNLIYNLL